MPHPSPARLLPNPALRAACTRMLSGHGAQPMRGWVALLAAAPELDLAIDVYSEGPAIERLEGDVAALLGKEAGLFFHKGVVAQQAVLLAHAAATGRRVVALHPASHLVLDEQDALDRLAGLLPLRLGSGRAHFTVADLDRAAEKLAAVTVELPLRRAGFIAPSWEELVAVADWARLHQVPLHLDGARLWEVQPWYGRSLAEIAALADTVYVSFYKGLGGMGGCVLAGPKAVIDAARPWRNRYGGDLPTIFPYVLTALAGLRRHLPEMARYFRHATALAAAIAQRPGLAVLPGEPHGNSFQVHFTAPVEALERAAVARSTGDKTWLFNRFEEGTLPGQAWSEIVVGEATLGWTPDEVADALADLQKA